MNRIFVHKSWDLLLLLIVIVAFLLRFWRFTDIPFTFDELSAMSRTVYDNFRDLIKYGVIEKDTHPAGVQVFMYYWIRMFGEAEWVVKLPFMLMGLASVWAAYAIAKLWFNATTAILTAACIATLQLFVLYSQIARPYASGLFLTLMMVYFWSRYFLKDYKLTDLVLFILFAALSSYNHHFSLLFAAIVGFSGLWFVSKDKRRAYVFAGIAIFILYIPHLPVFFAQLQKGGIGGWLAKPSPWFLFQFFAWLFHYSVWVLLVLAGGFSLLYFTSRKEAGIIKKRIRLFMLSWFLLPVIIGYAYSVLFEPVIQYSLLIFSTPYLFMLLFSYVGNARKRYLVPVVLLILIVNSLTLIFTREHYKVFYKQPFEHVVKDALTLERKNPQNVQIINNYVPYYTEYYFRKYGRTLPFLTVRNKDISTARFKKILTEIQENIVITSGLGSNYFQVIKEQFPHWTGYDRGFTFEEYVFAKTLPPDNSELYRVLISETPFNNDNANGWKFDREKLVWDSAAQAYIYEVSPQQEYSLQFKNPLNQMINNIYVFIDIEAEIKIVDSLTDAALVAEIKKEGETVRWLAGNFKDFNLKPGTWQKVFLTVDMQTAMNDKNKLDNSLAFKMFLWNKNKSRFLVKNIKIYIRPGNPYRYVLFTDIPKK
ncbi:MAG: hypothetical protein DRJ02_00695 [Bacteroidetes bacterium]|nr:MAG: hypothetical protein DRI72_00550 [Bacteroidota bacterium]RLD74596.1 MAG: hypothetical protein DRI87_00600 [Bacteroidota bacterium]RLD89634.1 MAG: hypothetical protein DRJ02_00695 [Bacteroidota bacterium]